jgi:hypothetical protein
MGNFVLSHCGKQKSGAAIQTIELFAMKGRLEIRKGVIQRIQILLGICFAYTWTLTIFITADNLTIKGENKKLPSAKLGCELAAW